MDRHRIASSIVAALVAGCGHTTSRVEASTTVVEHVVPREHATSVALRLAQGAGDIVVRQGPCEMITAHLQYDGARIEATVAVRREGAHAIVQIDEHVLGWRGWDHHGSRWEVCVSAGLIVDLEVDIGAGDVELDLDAIALHDLRISSGAGDVVIDLMDARPYAGRGDIDVGAGDVVIRLPAALGTKIDADVGAGDLDLQGFVRRDGAYVSPSWDHASARLHLSADVGAGDIEATLR
jgi:Cell wall-active antibiotics response 4TMS YvqF